MRLSEFVNKKLQILNGSDAKKKIAAARQGHSAAVATAAAGAEEVKADVKALMAEHNQAINLLQMEGRCPPILSHQEEAGDNRENQPRQIRRESDGQGVPDAPDLDRTEVDGQHVKRCFR
jgi:hypothetical protein